MQLFFIRHGATEYSHEFRFCGSTDVALSREGVRQARRLHALLQTQPVGQIYSSPLRRAAQTARIVFPRRKIVFADALREIDFGRLEGLTAADASATYPLFYRKWLMRPSQADPPGGERLAHFRRRVWQFVRTLTSRDAEARENVAIVTHGGPIKIVLSEIFGLGLEGLTKFHVEPASVAVVAFDGSEFSLVMKGFARG